MTGMTTHSAHTATTWLAWGRTALGATAMVAPTALARAWVGSQDDEMALRVLGRALGARDLALGLGAVLAQRHGAPVRGWVEAGGLADAGDLAATLSAFGSLPRATRWGMVALTGFAAVAARVVSTQLD